MDQRTAIRIWHEHRRLIIVVSVGLLLRVAWLIHAHPAPVSDYEVYHRLAQNLLDEGQFGLDAPTALHLPGYPWLLAGLMTISRSVGFLSTVMVVFSAAACVLVHRLALRLTSDEGVALVAAAACAVNPTFVLYSPLLATEHLFVPLALGAVLVAIRIPESPRARTPLLTGALLGLAALTRGEALFYVPVIAAIIWLLGDRHSRRVRVRQGLLVVAALGAVTMPWIIRNAVVVQPGITLSTAGGMNFYFAHNPDHYGWSEDVPWPPGDDLEANRIGWRLGLEHIIENPTSVLESVRDGTYGMLGGPSYALFWSSQQPESDSSLEFSPRYVRFEGLLSNLLVAGAATTLSLGLAAFLTWRSWTRRLRVVATTMLVGAWAGYAVLFFGHPRFRYTAETMLMILLAISLVSLRRQGSDDTAQTPPPLSGDVAA